VLREKLPHKAEDNTGLSHTIQSTALCAKLCVQLEGKVNDVVLCVVLLIAILSMCYTNAPNEVVENI